MPYLFLVFVCNRIRHYDYSITHFPATPQDKVMFQVLSIYPGYYNRMLIKILEWIILHAIVLPHLYKQCILLCTFLTVYVQLGKCSEQNNWMSNENGMSLYVLTTMENINKTYVTPVGYVDITVLPRTKCLPDVVTELRSTCKWFLAERMQAIWK